MNVNMRAKRIFTWNLTISSCEKGKYFGSTIDDSVVRCDVIIYTKKNSSNKFSQQKGNL